ncbi:MAG: PEP-CTERM sorting domain-containing protein [Deltaproteobacteria bacterium]
MLRLSSLGSILAILLMASSVNAATVVTLGDFTNPVELDFEALAPGPISTTDPYFTSVGISSVTVANGTPGGDILSANTDGQALASVNGVLAVAAVGGAIDDGNSGGNPVFTITFAGNQMFFGYSHIDQFGNFPVTFLLNNAVVDTFTFSGPFTAPVYLQAVAAFNMVQISQEAGNNSGYAIDNITFEGVAAAPEPATLLLLGSGLAAVCLFGRRKRA